MHSKLCTGLFASIALMPLWLSVPAAAITVDVSKPGDSGPNTLRSAIEAANTNRQINRIRFCSGLNNVELQTSVTYTGMQALTIDGNGATVTSDGAQDLLVANGGGNLYLESISFVAALKSGVVVNVPPGNAARLQVVSLADVVLDGNGWYGIHFDDKAGGDGTGSNSAASLKLIIRNSRVTNNNNVSVDVSASDKDGVRVDEGGEGDVSVIVVDSVLKRNAAEGIEIDESGIGNVVVSISGSSISGNGAQPQDPSDLEDGLDVDEAGSGDVLVRVVDSDISRNRSGGIDLDEANDGGIFLTATGMVSTGNTEENIRATSLQNEAINEGIIIASISKSTISRSIDDDGIELEIFDNPTDGNVVGKVVLEISGSSLTDNDDDDIEIEARVGDLVLRNTTYGDLDLNRGIVLIEDRTTLVTIGFRHKR